MRNNSKTPWLAPTAAIGSLVACYGTLAAVALLGALGVTIALNTAVWAGAILLFAGLTLLALLARWRRHGRRAPVALAGMGVLLIGYAMLVSYTRTVELAGFAALVAGTALDWRIGRNPAGQRA